MQSPSFFFRLDGSQEIGYGHFYRCHVLAEVLRKNGHAVRFLIRALDYKFKDLIVKKGYDVEVLDIVKNCDIETEFGWTSDLQADLDWTAAYSRDQVLICDHYSFGPAYFSRIKKQVSCLVAFDDYCKGFYPVDILLNQNFGAEITPPQMGPDTKALLGVRYALIRDEYFAAKSEQEESYVVVCFGATDPGNNTLSILQLLEEMKIPSVAVVGRGYAWFTELKNRFASNPEICVLQDPPGVERIFAQAKCIVAGAGGLIWELAFLGKAVGLIQTAPNQDLMMKGLLQNNAVLAMTEVSQRKNTLERLCYDQSIRQALKSNIEAIVDGSGKYCVIEAISERLQCPL